MMLPIRPPHLLQLPAGVAFMICQAPQASVRSRLTYTHRDAMHQPPPLGRRRLIDVKHLLLVSLACVLGAQSIITRAEDIDARITCDGTYSHHLQGICTDEQSLYWSFTTSLVKTDMDGKVLIAVPVANHHGDLCLHDGKLFVAVNLGAFNDPAGNANSWVYVYAADTLEELARHEVHQVFHGAGGIGVHDAHFFIVGGLPEGVDENFVYEYDTHFAFLKKHVIPSGHTHLGIQTAAFAHGRWWFGCYGSPEVLLVTDTDFGLLGRYDASCSLGVAGVSGGRLLVASGRCDPTAGCSGSVQAARPDDRLGFAR